MAYCPYPNCGSGETIMAAATCAACDYPLDSDAIKVTIAGKTVEVCCEECAQKLREANAAAKTAR